MIKSDLAVFGQFVFLFGLKQRNGMVIRRIAEKHHANFIAVGEFEAHNFSPELAGALQVADRVNYMADFFYLDWRLFVRHTSSLS